MNEVVAETGSSRVRDRFSAWFDRHEVGWELAMAALAVVYVALGFVVDELPGERPEIEAAEIALTGFFLAEFASRILATRDRRAYLHAHWVDLLALAPPIRGARILRLLRLLRLVRAFAGVYRAGLHLRALARHRGFAWLIGLWLAVMVLSSAGLFVAEHGQNRAIQTPFDALWWGVVTLTTVGYGDVVPATDEGRLAAMALMLLGIVLFSAITATITSFLLSHDAGREIAEAIGQGALAAELERLAALHSAGDLDDDEFSAAKARLIGVG